jgi:hypothetical protein
MEVEEVSALPMMEMTLTTAAAAAAAADEDPMVDIEVEEEEHNNNNNHNNNNKRWAEARLASGEHLLKRNKRSLEEDSKDDDQQPTTTSNIINIIDNDDDDAAAACRSSEDAGELVGGGEEQREAGLTGSGDEWPCTREPRMVDLESPVDSEWGEGEVRAPTPNTFNAFPVSCSPGFVCVLFCVCVLFLFGLVVSGRAERRGPAPRLQVRSGPGRPTQHLPRVQVPHLIYFLIHQC